MSRSVLWSASAALLLAACATKPPVATQEGPAIARPEVKAGDRWTYRRMDYWTNQATGTYELQVKSVDAKSIAAIATEKDGKAGEGRYTADWNAIVSALDQARITPDTGLLRFPLRAGATYPSKFHLDPVRSDAGVSVGADYDYTVKVLGWEEVVVPAGRYRALRIEAEGSMQRPPGRTGFTRLPVPSFARTVIWYVPEVRRWVKYVYEDSIQIIGLIRPEQRMGEELVEFTLK